MKPWMVGMAVAVATAAASATAWAQGYPARPVTLIVPFPPGGGTDTGGRILAEQLGKRWGQTVIVDNKGGAAGQIGADLVAKAKPDGYTLLLGNIGTQAIDPSLYAEGALPGFNSISWLGLLAPAGTPAEIVEEISADVRAVLADDAVKARYVALGGVPRGTTSAQFAKLIEDDRRRYAKVIADRKITAE